MKMLVCTDGSPAGQNALREGLKIAENYPNVETSIIYVYDTSLTVYEDVSGSIPVEVHDKLKISKEAEGKEILNESAKLFENKNLKVTTILKEGHPSSTIKKVASENNFDLLVVGNRGLSGLKRFILGSVSNAVAQEVKSNVLIVKQPE